MALKFIDVSHHNGNVNFSKIKLLGYDGVILRAGYGKIASQVDRKFEDNYADAKKAGLKVGAYWYSYATTKLEAVQEAKACLEVIKGKQFDFPVYFDIEDKCHTSLSKKACTDIVNAFCGEMERNKYWVGVYSFDSFFGTNLEESVQQRYAIWVARVDGSKPKDCKTYQGWQYSWKGKIAGHSCDFDLNTFAVDYSPVIRQRGLNGYGKTSVEQPNEIVSPYKGKFRVSQEFKGNAHQGLDLVGIDSKNLYATVDGTVEISGNNDPNGFGTYVRILASDGSRYYYGHMSKTAVKVGDKVKCGDFIGVEGSTGRSTGSHCHYEVRMTLNKLSYDDINRISGIPNKLGTYEDKGIKRDVIVSKTLLTVASGTWNIRSSANASSKVIRTVKGGSIYEYTHILNGWAYIPSLKGWLSSKGYSIKRK